MNRVPIRRKLGYKNCFTRYKAETCTKTLFQNIAGFEIKVMEMFSERSSLNSTVVCYRHIEKN